MLKSVLANSVMSCIRCASTSAASPGKLSGKIAVVTASTDGIGYAIAKRLGHDGARVVVSSRKADNVDKAMQSLRDAGVDVSGMPCHAGKENDRKALIDKVKNEHGRIDILVCNTGINPYFGKTLDTPEAAFDKIFDVNVKSTFMLIKEAVPLIKNSQSGCIVINSSIAGYSAIDQLGIYSVSKTALIGLTKVLSAELAASNIRVNCIAPGIIKTSFSKALWSSPNISEVIVNKVPLGRLADPDECGGIVSFLASDDASYITGETIVVAGGMPSRL